MKRFCFPILLLWLVCLFHNPCLLFAASADCDIDKGACSKTIGNVEVILDIQPKPVRAMRELNVYVALKGMDVHDRLKLNFDMPGMYMGKNEVVLKRIAHGRYKGVGVIPRCPSGKRLWRATVILTPSLESPTQKSQKIEKVSFLFNVTY